MSFNTFFSFTEILNRKKKEEPNKVHYLLMQYLISFDLSVHVAIYFLHCCISYLGKGEKNWKLHLIVFYLPSLLFFLSWNSFTIEPVRVFEIVTSKAPKALPQRLRKEIHKQYHSLGHSLSASNSSYMT